jgi:hypothetical protein
MDLRRIPSRALALACALPLIACGPAAGSSWRGSNTIRIDVADGTLDVTLRPDHGRSLTLSPDGGNRWSFEGNTSSLVGQPYSIELRNRTRERLKVVVSVDGLNVYGREIVAGYSSSDVGSILAPWADRTLPGWQLDDRRAQRFVFSPPEWSEGEGRTDSKIGLVLVHVYREVPQDYSWKRERDSSEPMARPAPEGGARRHHDESAAEAQAPAGVEAEARRAPIGTSSGDDVASHVRTVTVLPATERPEAWAVIDYGQQRARVEPWPRPRWEDDELLGLDLGSASDGTRIFAVEPGSAADRAGLEADDVIVRIDTTYAPTPAATRRILLGKARGDYAFLRVRRGPHELAVKIRT